MPQLSHSKKMHYEFGDIETIENLLKIIRHES